MLHQGEFHHDIHYIKRLQELLQEDARKNSNAKLDQEFATCILNLDFHAIPTTLLGLKDICCI